jgi:transposase-like protein
VSWKERKVFDQELRAIYAAATAEATEQAQESFEKKWQGRFPSFQVQLRMANRNQGAIPSLEADWASMQ